MLEEQINKINTMEANINLILELHLQQSNNLTTYNDVSKFLEVTAKTIPNYVKNGKFEKEIHYFIKDNGKTVFIPSAIIEFKKGVKLNNKTVINDEFNKDEDMSDKRVNNPIVSNMLKGVA